MEKAGETFEIHIAGQFDDKPVTIRPEQTTDGVPIYQCSVEGTPIGQLRREPSGKWEQLWGNLPQDTVQHLGEVIASQME